MSQIGLVEVDPASVPTPPTGAQTIFLANDTHVLSVKDDSGTVTPLAGTSGLPVGGVLTGTLPNPGLASTTVVGGAYGDASHIATLTVGADGRLTAATTVAVAIAESAVTNLVTDLAAKAPLASPTFTGDPKAPTASPGDNDTSIATTAFVTAAVGAGGVVSSVFGRTGAVVAASADYSVAQVTGAAPLASPTFTGTVTVPTTVNATDAAQKSYVDAAIAGLSWKQEVRVATAAAGTLATSFANGQTVDGITMATGDRILIKDQVSGAENGIYVVAVAGAPTRSTDATTGAQLVDASMYVSEGTVNADTQWVCSTNAPITAGVTALSFVQLTSGGATALGGLTDVTLTSPSDGDVLTYDSGSGDWINAVPSGGGASRATVTQTTASLADSATESSTVTLAKSGFLFQVIADRAARVILYATSADRTADASRVVGVPATPGTGVLGEWVFTGAMTIDNGPTVAYYNGDGSPVTSIYYAITNMSGSTHTVQIQFVHLGLES